MNPSNDPLWYKHAIFYEVLIRGFYDSSHDGTGDIKGVIDKLDYLQWLGVDCLWLLPFFQSPLRDGGYDISDFRSVLPEFGNVEDIANLVEAAHARGMRVISDMVMNHTSDQHPWFQESRIPGSDKRDWYVWSDTDDRYRGARVIFVDTEHSNWTWDHDAQAYYWHRFFSHQPDLNYDNPEVGEAMLDVIRFWLSIGLDGFRLDAVPYLYERENTNCENLPETHEFLKRVRKVVDAEFEGKVLLAEANQWPEDVVPYFGDGDECHMAFHFPVMPRMFMGLRREEARPIVEILEQTPDIPDNAQWGIFLRNHDELTLEMVTDEERDYMYTEYAADPRMKMNVGIRRRLAPLLDNNRRVIELFHALLFSLPGSPVMYYGDEIGMGDNIYLGDRDGVRTPMQWTIDRNGGVQPRRVRRAVHARKHGSGLRLRLVQCGVAAAQPQLAAALGPQPRAHPEALPRVRGWVVHRAQAVQRQGPWVPARGRRHDAVRGQPVRERATGRARSSPLQRESSCRAARWDAFPARRRAAVSFDPRPLRLLLVPPRRAGARSVSLVDLLEPAARERIGQALATWLPDRRWFQGKARTLRSTSVADVLLLDERVLDIFVDVDYVDGGTDRYQVPLTVARDGAPQPPAHAVLEVDGVTLVDALVDAECCRILAGLVTAEATHETAGGATVVGRPVTGTAPRPGDRPRLMSAEQSNSSVVVGDRHIMKVLRRLEPGTHPDVEITRGLTQAGFVNVPAQHGSCELRAAGREPTALAVIADFVAGGREGWELATQEASAVAAGEPADGMGDKLADLGIAIARMHAALARCFGHRQATVSDLAGWADAMRGQLDRVLTLAADQAPDATAEVLDRAAQLQDAVADIRALDDGGPVVRIHGDLHLGQVLLDAGGSWQLLDFEGEPARPLAERREPSSPLRDVAGMLRSFDYAAAAGALARGGDVHPLSAELAAWRDQARRHLLFAYLREARDLLPHPGTTQTLLAAFELDKAIYELGYELANRPTWVPIPASGIVRVLSARDGGTTAQQANGRQK